MKLKSIFFLLFLTSILYSCGTTKVVTGSAVADATLSAKQIAVSHNAAVPEFNTLAGRLYVSYENEKSSRGIGVSLRMEKDNKIWIKVSILGATIAKALITPDQVQYYETINNEYFDGDFALLSDLLGTDIDFKKAQAILLGQSIFPLNGNSYNVTIDENHYKLQPKNDLGPFVFQVLLNPDSFKVSEESIRQPSENRMLDIKYGPYQKFDDRIFPTKINIDAIEDNKMTKIEVTYRDVDINPSINFSFTIPEGYKRIIL